MAHGHWMPTEIDQTPATWPSIVAALDPGNSWESIWKRVPKKSKDDHQSTQMLLEAGRIHTGICPKLFNWLFVKRSFETEQFADDQQVMSSLDFRIFRYWKISCSEPRVGTGFGGAMVVISTRWKVENKSGQNFVSPKKVWKPWRSFSKFWGIRYPQKRLKKTRADGDTPNRPKRGMGDSELTLSCWVCRGESWPGTIGNEPSRWCQWCDVEVQNVCFVYEIYIYMDACLISLICVVYMYVHVCLSTCMYMCTLFVLST